MIRASDTMIDEKYSADNFENELMRNDISRALSDALEKEIQAELHEVLLEKIQDIVGKLNSMGHNLRFYYPPLPGDISYRDEENGHCKLRVSSDCIISIGYSDVIEQNNE